MCAHVLKFVCIFVLMFACGARPTHGGLWPTLGERTSLSDPKCDKCARHNHTQSHDWDYLQFVVQWPQSFCLQFNHSKHTDSLQRHHNRPSKKCIIPRNIRHWTIHGLWPSRMAGINVSSPQCCNNSWTFKMSEIDDLLPELNQSWPDLFVGGALGTFWCHEWGTHGTCSASLPALYGEHNYFSKTMGFLQRFNIDKALSDAGIVPSSTRYKLADIQQAVQSATGVTADIQCFSFKTQRSLQYLWEIRLCLDKAFAPRNCPARRTSGCRFNVEILFPPIP